MTHNKFHYPNYLVAKGVANALAEDLNLTPDWTANLIPDDKISQAYLKTNQDMVVCGTQWFTQTILLLDPQASIQWNVIEGEFVQASTTLCHINAHAKSLLSAERSAINWLQTLSATATTTKTYVDKIAGLGALIMDSRKTIPMLRHEQKYAVCVGGGHNQRLGLYDGVLIKENHIIAHGGIANVLHHGFINTPKHIPIQIEVENYAEFTTALEHGAKLILLDNMNCTDIKRCVDYCQDPQVILEVSGNVTLDNIYEYAATGIQRISIGSLTKNIQAIDLSLRFIN